jgi:VanZ family protein
MKLQNAFRILLGTLLILVTHFSFTSRHYFILDNPWDKANHLAAFATLAFACDFAFPRQKYGPAKILSLLAYGLLIELIQSFLSYRFFEVADLVADGLGLLVYGLSLPLLRRMPFLRRRWSA